jgi:predicted TIM-barrel fold metal-dependent hydrolase
LTDRRWYPLYEKMVELDVPAMVHVAASCNPNFHGTGAHYINGDTSAFMQGTNPLTRERAAREGGASGTDGVTK